MTQVFEGGACVLSGDVSGRRDSVCSVPVNGRERYRMEWSY